jgi:hypothetical protein
VNFIVFPLSVINIPIRSFQSRLPIKFIIEPFPRVNVSILSFKSALSTPNLYL